MTSRRSSPSSRASADSTGDSNSQAGDASDNASPTSTGEECSPPASPESPATRTFVKSQRAHDPEDCERWEEAEAAPTLDAAGHSPRTATIVLNLRGREEGIRPELDTLASLRAAEGGSSRS